jgi:predicted AAA+ superfamily ATPase
VTRRAARGRRADFARKIGADYSRRWPNCNVAGSPPFHLGRFWPFGLPALARPAKGRPQRGANMAKSRARPSLGRSRLGRSRLGRPSLGRPNKKATKNLARAGGDEAHESGGDAALLARIAGALERLAPAAPAAPDFTTAEAFVWHPEGRRLTAIHRVNRVDMSLLKGIDRVRDLLVENTERFARGLPANNALLWGARGMGKSSLVKAAHAATGKAHPAAGLKLIEIHREDIESLPELMSILRNARQRFIVFCDDLSFDAEDTSYKSLKTMLEGGIEGRPENVIFYATSNRRHLLARDMMENERSTAINPGEAVEEKVSLSDRFGLWLGFHRCSQDEYLAMVEGYVAHYRVPFDGAELRREALEWATTRGARSGRVAWQYVQDLAGRLGVRMSDDR